ncbi:MAG TPA: sulfur carrier protein ThiS [Bryobacteraceae bacterium]|nr:sulfur carrier protein ThiS [Bryobacteraceae bacterium]
MPDTTGMEVIVNGEPHQTTEGQTVAGLLAALGLESSKVAVELDRVIVSRPEWASRVLGHGARLEIVHFVGGG